MKAKFQVSMAALVLGLAAIAGSASAKPTPIDPNKVQSLATQIEAALSQVGCGATADQDMATIQSAIAGSGASPSEAEAALEVVQSSAGLCPSASVAVASVNKTIELALAGGSPAAGPGSGPGGGAPIGGPAAYVGGGGSNYQVQ